MRRRITSRLSMLGAVCITLLPLGLKADITVGSNDSGNCYPFMCNDSGTSSGPSIEYQQVYSSVAFSGITNISGLTYYFASAIGGNEAILNGNYNITLSTTSATVGGLNSTLSSNIGADHATFFNGALGGAYTNSFTISGTPFTYNPGNGNLLIDIFVTNQANVTNSSFPAHGYNEADYTGVSTRRSYAFLGSGSGSDQTGALVTTFTTSAATTPEPGFYGLLAIGLSSLAVVLRRRKA